MKTLTKQDITSNDRVNRDTMLGFISEFRDIEARLRKTEQACETAFQKKNKLLPRERLSLLIDDEPSFLELSTLAGYQL